MWKMAVLPAFSVSSDLKGVRTGGGKNRNFGLNLDLSCKRLLGVFLTLHLKIPNQ